MSGATGVRGIRGHDPPWTSQGPGFARARLCARLTWVRTGFPVPPQLSCALDQVREEVGDLRQSRSPRGDRGHTVCSSHDLPNRVPDDATADFAVKPLDASAVDGR